MPIRNETEPMAGPVAEFTKKGLSKLAFVGDYAPRQCGIATFTCDLRRAVAGQFPEVDCQVVAVTDPKGDYDYPPEVAFEVAEEKLADYRRVAEFLQFQNVECVSVQHEFGIYGGPEGSHLLTFLRELKLPVVTTCHTLLERPSATQERVFRELASLSRRMVAMTERGRRILGEVYGVPDERIAVIPHGIPDMPFVDPAFYKDKFGIEGKKALLTFGLLSPNKGLEYAIGAMPRILEAHPEAVFIILGATHPNLVRKEGEDCRYKLQQLAHDLGVEEQVLFVDRFVALEELAEFIGACDVYVTPYVNAEQIVSGTLSYAFGWGKAIVSTPYWHAEELLAGGRGRLVPFRDAGAIAEAVVELFSDEKAAARMRKEAYLAGRDMVWNRVAQSYMELFREARQSSAGRPRVELLHEPVMKRFQLPEINLDHLRRMTDSTGLLQHAAFTFPDFREGYCVDDNARGLVFAAHLDSLRSEASEAKELARVYAAFLNYGFNPANGWFRNFMSFERSWLDERGSDDAHGRSLWALGACVGRSKERSLRNWAANLFERALPAVWGTTSPRAWAFALLGLREYLRRMGGSRPARAARAELANRMMNLYRKVADEDWKWFEKELAYDNAKLPHALIAAGRSMGEGSLRAVGLEALDWLVRQQTNAAGQFAPIGSEGFYRKGGAKAEFDQQPLEAQATVSACLEAYLATRENRWGREALKAFRWFLGSNKLGEQIYDHATGGCRDGLHVDRVNQNEGAESTLAFLQALVEIKESEQALSSFLEPLDLEEREDDEEASAPSAATRAG